MEVADIKQLKAGEHYGSVFHKQRTPTAVFRESVYGQRMGLPEHSHELGFFTLIIDGYYSEVIGSRTFVYSPKTVLWRQADLTHTDKIEAASSRFFFVEIEKSFGLRMRETESVPDHLIEKNGRMTWLASHLRNDARKAPCTNESSGSVALLHIGDGLAKLIHRCYRSVHGDDLFDG